MNYIPLGVFFLAIAWIVWRGYQAKRDYLRDRTAQEKASRK
jgi:hypothetical protein